jgi:hypothetical protein
MLLEQLRYAQHTLDRCVSFSVDYLRLIHNLSFDSAKADHTIPNAK